jgi:NAD(P)H dehydrogenase (quinone)
MYGHIQKLAEAEKKGIEAAGGEATIYQYGTALTRFAPWA